MTEHRPVAVGPGSYALMPDSLDELRADMARGLSLVAPHVSWRDLATFERELPNADVWYIERNGDPIGLLEPRGTPIADLPRCVFHYRVREWIKPGGLETC